MTKAVLHKIQEGYALSLYDKGFNHDTVVDMPYTKVECLANDETGKVTVFVTIETEMKMPAMVKCDQLYYMQDIDMTTVNLDDRFFKDPKWGKKIIALAPKEGKA